MSRLDLADIQGNIHRPYGRFGFPHTRHIFFHIAGAQAGRDFVDTVRGRVTTAEPWGKTESDDGSLIVAKPVVTMNIGFTWLGLQALDLPTRTLRMMPDEFIDTMGCRSHILGDVGDSAPEHWDPVWNYSPLDRKGQVHIWVSINVAANRDGSPDAALTDWTDWLTGLAANSNGGVGVLAGHGPSKALWQDSSALMTTLPDGGRTPIPKEHFGFTDGISDPVFRGQFAAETETRSAAGTGKIATGKYDEATSWSALETGEFILGHTDEGQEQSQATHPAGFVRNGTFMVWRKLQQNISAFHAEVARQADILKRMTGLPSDEAARETVYAKMAGRWRTGIPLMVAPDWDSHLKALEQWSDILPLMISGPKTDADRDRLAAYSRMLTAFNYAPDPEGARCPLGAHIRRANPRDTLDPKATPEGGNSTLVNRRRFLRRGLPYGTADSADGEHGVVFMTLCASIFRQFEFTQQQWMEYGLDFEAGNDTCPLVGGRTQSDTFVIPGAGPEGTPFIAAGLPQFVTTRGGDYFFIPSMSALRMIAMGTIDPT